MNEGRTRKLLGELERKVGEEDAWRMEEEVTLKEMGSCLKTLRMERTWARMDCW